MEAADCHHKAIMRFKEEKSLMEKMGLRCEVLESGCCGMAGSFGYEKDKYEVSVACGERALLPRVRQEAASTFIMADGFSCKEQIAQQSNRQALHLAEVMQMALQGALNATRAVEKYAEEAGVNDRNGDPFRFSNADIRAIGLTLFIEARRRS